MVKLLKQPLKNSKMVQRWKARYLEKKESENANQCYDLTNLLHCFYTLNSLFDNKRKSWKDIQEYLKDSNLLDLVEEIKWKVLSMPPNYKRPDHKTLVQALENIANHDCVSDINCKNSTIHSCKPIIDQIVYLKNLLKESTTWSIIDYFKDQSDTARLSEHFKDENEVRLTKTRFRVLWEYSDPKLCHLFVCAALEFSGEKVDRELQIMICGFLTENLKEEIPVSNVQDTVLKIERLLDDLDGDDERKLFAKSLMKMMSNRPNNSVNLEKSIIKKFWSFILNHLNGASFLKDLNKVFRNPDNKLFIGPQIEESIEIYKLVKVTVQPVNSDVQTLKFLILVRILNYLEVNGATLTANEEQKNKYIFCFKEMEGILIGKMELFRLFGLFLLHPTLATYTAVLSLREQMTEKSVSRTNYRNDARVEFLSILSGMIRRFIPHKNEDKILDLMENVKNFEIIIRFCKTYMDGQFGNNHSIKRKLNGVEDKLFNPASVTVAENDGRVLRPPMPIGNGKTAKVDCVGHLSHENQETYTVENLYKERSYNFVRYKSEFSTKMPTVSAANNDNNCNFKSLCSDCGTTIHNEPPTLQGRPTKSIEDLPDLFFKNEAKATKEETPVDLVVDELERCKKSIKSTLPPRFQHNPRKESLPSNKQSKDCFKKRKKFPSQQLHDTNVRLAESLYEQLEICKKNKLQPHEALFYTSSMGIEEVAVTANFPKTESMTKHYSLYNKDDRKMIPLLQNLLEFSMKQYYLSDETYTISLNELHNDFELAEEEWNKMPKPFKFLLGRKICANRKHLDRVMDLRHGVLLNIHPQKDFTLTDCYNFVAKVNVTTFLQTQMEPSSSRLEYSDFKEELCNVFKYIINHQERLKLSFQSPFDVQTTSPPKKRKLELIQQPSKIARLQDSAKMAASSNGSDITKRNHHTRDIEDGFNDYVEVKPKAQTSVCTSEKLSTNLSVKVVSGFEPCPVCGKKLANHFQKKHAKESHNTLLRCDEAPCLQLSDSKIMLKNHKAKTHSQLMVGTSNRSRRQEEFPISITGNLKGNQKKVCQAVTVWNNNANINGPPTLSPLCSKSGNAQSMEYKEYFTSTCRKLTRHKAFKSQCPLCDFKHVGRNVIYVHALDAHNLTELNNFMDKIKTGTTAASSSFEEEDSVIKEQQQQQKQYSERNIFVSVKPNTQFR